MGSLSADAMGSLVGGAAEGIFNFGGASEQASVSREQLDFQKQRYQDWYKVYGSLQEDLGTYYKNLSGADLSAQERVKIQEAAQKAQEELNVQMTQRGITGSGIEASLMSNINWQAELAKAQSQATADQRVAQQQMGFLGLGVGQGSTIAGQMQTASNTYGQNVGNMWSGLGEDIGQWSAMYGRVTNPTGATNTPPPQDSGWMY